MVLLEALLVLLPLLQLVASNTARAKLNAVIGLVDGVLNMVIPQLELGFVAIIYVVDRWSSSNLRYGKLSDFI